MKINKFAVVLAIAALSLQAVADQQEPAYWMKQYPTAPSVAVITCLALSEAAYEKAGGTQGRGDNGFAVLAKGTAWEACMDKSTSTKEKQNGTN